MQKTMTDRNVSHPVVKGVSRKKVRTNEITTDDQNTPAKLDTESSPLWAKNLLCVLKSNA